MLIVLASAPLWAPRVGLGLPSPPPPGILVPIAGGYRVNVIDEGSGPSVVLVHGLPGSAHDWRPLPEQLVAAGFRVIRYDRVGYGYSNRRRPGESYGIEANGTDLLRLVGALKLEEPILVGWSYGGGVVQNAAAMGAPQVGALLLVGSDGSASRSFGWFATWFEITEPLRRWGVASGFPVRLGVARMARQAFKESVPPWWPAHAMSVVVPDGVVRTWTKEVSDFDPASIHSEKISVPVTLIHGTEDTFVPRSIAEALHDQIPGSVLVTVDGAGHMLPNTHPGLIIEELKKLLHRRQKPIR